MEPTPKQQLTEQQMKDKAQEDKNLDTVTICCVCQKPSPNKDYDINKKVIVSDKNIDQLLGMDEMDLV